MDVTADTRIAEAVAADPDLIARLVALSPLFQRLNDPDALRTMASQVTLREAAAMAGVPLADLLTAANARSPAACAATFRDAPEEERPEWMADFAVRPSQTLDVRPLIRDGREPFTLLMTAAAAVADGDGLVIEAPFNPLPLRAMLERKGLASYAERLAPDHWRVYCLRGEAAPPKEMPPVSSDFGATVWRDHDGVHIDVRALEAPAPMLAILQLTDGPGHGGRIIVHHRRDPLYLYPELAERGWSWQRIEGEPGEIRLVLTKNGG